LYMIQTDAQGERSFLYWRDQAPAKQLFQTANADRLINQLMGFDWIFYSGITLAILESAGREALFGALERFRERGGTVVFDVNYRPRLWQDDDPQHWIAEAYKRADISLPSVDDEHVLWSDESDAGVPDATAVIERLGNFGCQEIVLKRGSESCLVNSGGKEAEFPVTPVEEVVDTTAAGDSFNAGYLSARMQGKTVAAAVAAGQSVSAQVIAQPGAIVPVDV